MSETQDQALVIFGASGDLTSRKLIPALFDLYCGKFLAQNYAIVGVGRTAFDDQAFRDKVVLNNPVIINKDIATPENLKGFNQRLFYQQLDMTDASDFSTLGERLKTIEQECDTSCNYVFYMATPPKLYETISLGLSTAGLSNETNGFKRLIVEKPFGYNLETAKALNQKLHKCFDEHQIYRIDHYLGKETVQNLFVTRFANSIFEPLWNRNYINRVEITSAESVGVEKRGGYYDGSGALRDMVQNHLLQLVALVAMEPPVKVNDHSIRSEKLKLFQSLRPFSEKDLKTNVIRGQYTESVVKGESVVGYRNEPGVNPESRTETYLAMKFYIDNWRWAGIPFYVRTGKKLPTRVTEIVIHFKSNHHHLFIKHSNILNSRNMLVLRIQPNEGILMKFGVKVPGAGYNVENVNMDFHYDELTDVYVPGPYERLLLDCMQGDATLYARGDSVEAAWEFVDPILQIWESNSDFKMWGYPAGSWGPEHADTLIDGEDLTWRYPCKNLADDGIYCEL